LQGNDALPLLPPAEPLGGRRAEDRHEGTDVQGVRRRIEPDVTGDGAAGGEARRQAGRRRVQDAAPLEFRQESGQSGRIRRRTARRTESTGASTRREDAVTRHHRREGVVSERLSHGARCTRIAKRAGDIAITQHATRPDRTGDRFDREPAQIG